MVVQFIFFFTVPFFSLYWSKVMFGDAFQFNNAECIATPTCMQRKKNQGSCLFYVVAILG